jgi:TRAP-type uncharacterized transport system fused permease subunit
VYNTALLLLDTTPLVALRVTITAIIGVSMIGMATEGFALTGMKWIERILAFVGALLLITADPIQDAVGFVILVVILFFQFRKKRRTA